MAAAGDLTTFSFSFDPEVVRQTSEFPAFNWTTFLADLGGSLGLWLGLGVSQILEFLVKYISEISGHLNNSINQRQQ